MLPPAPVMFSTRTVCPRLFVIRSAMIRAIVSVGPPAENGTTIVTGFVGKLCANAALQKETTATAKKRNLFMTPPLRAMVTAALSAGESGLWTYISGIALGSADRRHPAKHVVHRRLEELRPAGAGAGGRLALRVRPRERRHALEVRHRVDEVGVVS